MHTGMQARHLTFLKQETDLGASASVLDLPKSPVANGAAAAAGFAG